MIGTTEVFHGTRGSICLRSPPASPELRSQPSPEFTQPLLEVESLDVFCRICHMQCHEGSLLSPCWCSGSVQHVCQDCLNSWRSTNEKKSMNCELCGFAFLYETERVPLREQAPLVVMRSKRCFALLVCAITYGLLRICGSQIVEPFPLWLVGLIWAQLGSDVISSAAEADPQLGSFGYSLRRLRAKTDVDAMDLWMLHKAEWARYGIRPFESPYATTAPLLLLPQPLQIIGGSLLVLPITFGGFVLMGSFIVWFYANPFFVAFFESKRGQIFEERIVTPLFTIGMMYLVCAALLHIVSVIRSPPLRLATDAASKPCIRSLLPHEKRSRVVFVA